MEQKIALITGFILIFSLTATAQTYEDFQNWDNITDSCDQKPGQKYFLANQADGNQSYPDLREYVRLEGEKVNVVNCSNIGEYYFVRKTKTVGDVLPDSNDSDDLPYWINKALVILLIFGVKLSYDIYQKYG